MIIKRIAIAGLILVSVAANSGGTAVNRVGARGSAIQAFVALADDPSAIYYNPAGLSQLTTEQWQGGALWVAPNLNYTNSNNNVSTKSTRQAIGANLFYVRPINQKWRFGFGVYAPFARVSRYQNNAAVASPTLASAEQSALFIRMDAAPTLSYQINETLSLGGSAVLSFGKADSNSFGLDESGEGFGATGQVGLIWKASSTVKVGVDYRGPETINMKGNGRSILGVFPGGPGAQVNGRYTSKVRYPGTLSLGMAWQINSKWLLSTEYDNEMWSSVKVAERNYANRSVSNSIDGKNSNDYRVGLAYTPNPNHSFYTGYTYIGFAIPAINISPAQPDYDQNVLSLGYSYKQQQWQFDATYEYASLKKWTSNSAGFPGRYFGHNQQVLLNVSYRA